MQHIIIYFLDFVAFNIVYFTYVHFELCVEYREIYALSEMII